MRRLEIIGTVTVGCLLLTVAGVGVSQAQTMDTPRSSLAARSVTAAAASLRIGVSTVQYDSPGGTVPAIVTVYNVSKGSKVTISATGGGASKASCAGAVWQNPVRHTASRTCYLQLPVKAGKYSIRGSAKITKNGVTRTVSGSVKRPVVADGKVSPVPMSAAAVQQVERCSNTTKDVWLTFDDGGSAAQVNTILATLKRNNVKAHFLFRGDWMRKNPALFKKIKAAGHVVGNHTSTHPALSRMGKTNVMKQIDKGTAATGSPKLLRPPFGAGAFTTRLQKIAQSKGYRLCRWTTDTYDWDGPSAKLMVERVQYGDYRSAPVRAGGVILMHGHGKHTASGLQQIINAVRAKHLKLQRLG
jgi:peptidoglycan/xylan/chitin deacetylase (PgdA/CDA1 family)